MTSPYRPQQGKPGQRGRPRPQPKPQLDLSDVSSALGEVGERLAAILSKLGPVGIGAARLLRRAPRRALRLVVIGVIAIVGATALIANVSNCLRTQLRRQALGAITGLVDQASGEAIGERIRSGDFSCSDLGDPRGVIVTAREDGEGEPIIWFVDATGAAHTVNLLAMAWTPALPPAESIPEEVLERE